MIVVVGLSHKTAPIGVRERLALDRDSVPALLEQAVRLPQIGEAALLSTCNRVELYAAPRARRGENGVTSSLDLDGTAHAAAQLLASVGGEAVAPHLVARTGDAALAHAFRVAASLDSLVVGEPQILGQVKEAIAIAQAARALGPTLARALDSAVRVGKRVRAETQIGAGQVSIATVAVDLARQIFGELDGKRAMLLGAGEMAEGAAKLVARGGAKLIIVNRSAARAAALATELGAEARTLDALEATLAEVDIVIASTASPSHLVTVDVAKRVMRARRGKSLFFVDIAVPRDVEPAVHKLDNVYLYDVDDLSRLVADSVSGRAAEAEKAQRIVAIELEAFDAWVKTRSIKPAIVALRARTRAVLLGELERSLKGRLRHLPPSDRDALSAMLEAATNKLLHGPTTQLKSMAASPRSAEIVAALREVFDLPDDATSAADGEITAPGEVDEALGGATALVADANEPVPAA